MTFEIRGGVASQGAEESSRCYEAHVPFDPSVMRLTPGVVVTEHIDTPLESRQLYSPVLEVAVAVAVAARVQVCVLRYNSACRHAIYPVGFTIWL